MDVLRVPLVEDKATPVDTIAARAGPIGTTNVVSAIALTTLTGGHAQWFVARSAHRGLLGGVLSLAGAAE